MAHGLSELLSYEGNVEEDFYSTFQVIKCTTISASQPCSVIFPNVKMAVEWLIAVWLLMVWNITARRSELAPGAALPRVSGSTVGGSMMRLWAVVPCQHRCGSQCSLPGSLGQLLVHFQLFALLDATTLQSVTWLVKFIWLQDLFCLTQKMVKAYLVILCILSRKSHFSNSLFLQFCLTCVF